MIKHEISRERLVDDDVARIDLTLCVTAPDSAPDDLTGHLRRCLTDTIGALECVTPELEMFRPTDSKDNVDAVVVVKPGIITTDWTIELELKATLHFVPTGLGDDLNLIGIILDGAAAPLLQDISQYLGAVLIQHALKVKAAKRRDGILKQVMSQDFESGFDFRKFGASIIGDRPSFMEHISFHDLSENNIEKVKDRRTMFGSINPEELLGRHESHMHFRPVRHG